MQDNKIYQTNNYDLFKKLLGNRDVLDGRKNVIKKSIVENGYIRNPIVVNEKMEIIDGQGRFEALKELGMPIEYVIAEGVGHKECVVLNANQKNWKTPDYIKSFSMLGIKDYQILEKMCDMFSHLDPANISTVCCGLAGGGMISIKIREGNFKIHKEEDVIKRLKLYESIYEITCGNADYGLQRAFASVVTFIYETKEIDNERVVSQMKKCAEFITPSFNPNQALKNIELVYNRCLKKHIYFMPLYDEWKKSKKSNTDN